MKNNDYNIDNKSEQEILYRMLMMSKPDQRLTFKMAFDENWSLKKTSLLRCIIYDLNKSKLHRAFEWVKGVCKITEKDLIVKEIKEEIGL